MSTPRTAGRLKSFRLADVDTKLRLKAARTISNRRNLAIPDDEIKPEDRLLALLRSNIEADVDTSDHEGIFKVAEDPSDKTYWISQRAWESVMGRAS